MSFTGHHTASATTEWHVTERPPESLPPAYDFDNLKENLKELSNDLEEIPVVTVRRSARNSMNVVKRFIAWSIRSLLSQKRVLRSYRRQLDQFAAEYFANNPQLRSE